MSFHNTPTGNLPPLAGNLRSLALPHGSAARTGTGVANFEDVRVAMLASGKCNAAEYAYWMGSASQVPVHRCLCVFRTPSLPSLSSGRQ